jgi:hypothetical protein
MNLLISFSGGETSAYMTLWCLENISRRYDRVIVVFANTGQENEETLEFVDRFDKTFGIGVVWLESKVVHGSRTGTGYKITDFENADRDGALFEDMIKKYGIPNKSYPHCTRELKLAPINAYCKAINLDEYKTAVGIRVDEIDRMSASAKKNGLIYPLVSMKPMTKPMINQWWEAQDFRLNLKGYQGNCKWCWKKSLRKHLTLINENPSAYDFPERMEKEHGLSGHNVDGTKRVFFRENRTTKDLRDMAEKHFTKADDDAAVYPDPNLFGHNLDLAGGCSESCEIDFDEDAV